VQRRAERRRVAIAGIREHGRHVDVRRQRLAQQPQGQFPFLLEDDGRRDARLLAARAVPEPSLRQIQGGADQPRVRAAPEGRRHGDLTVADLAQRPGVLPRDADRLVAVLGKARVVENHHARAGRQCPPEHAPQRRGVPRRIGDEMLKRLIPHRRRHPREHGLHRFPRAVAQQPRDVLAQGGLLSLVAEALPERREPFHQATKQRPRTLVEHCCRAYRRWTKSTMTSHVITLGRSHYSRAH
jgi:hypothetical protein